MSQPRPTPAPPRRLAAVVAALLVAASALFAIGVGLEHAHPHHDAASEQPAAHTEASETGPESAHTDSDADGTEQPPAETRETGEHAAGETGESETVLGIKIESPGTVAAVVAASLLLAAAIWRRPSTSLYTLIALFTAAAAVFDIAEIHHQTTEGTIAVAAIAAAVAALHTATFLITAKTASATRSKRPRTA